MLERIMSCQVDKPLPGVVPPRIFAKQRARELKAGSNSCQVRLVGFNVAKRLSWRHRAVLKGNYLCQERLYATMGVESQTNTRSAHLVPEEKHGCAWVIQLVHGIEVRHLRDVHQVDDCKVFHLLGSASQNLRGKGAPTAMEWRAETVAALVQGPMDPCDVLDDPA